MLLLGRAVTPFHISTCVCVDDSGAQVEDIFVSVANTKVDLSETREGTVDDATALVCLYGVGKFFRSRDL